MFIVALLLSGIIASQCAIPSERRHFAPLLTPIAAPQLDGRIVGGREVSIARHPHQISLRYRSCNSCAYSHLCGGSIYNENVIVTAAHCVMNRITESFIVVAATENRNGADGVAVRVEKIVIHENYYPALTDNDVAIIFLSSPLPINNKTIAPIPLASIHPANGVTSRVTGWGATSEGGFSSNKLLEVTVPIVSNEICNQAYGEGRITDSMLCAGASGGGKDACQGDSGGPLVVDGELAGIVSWGRGCARPDFPGVYASVAHLKDWIVNEIKNNV